MTTSDALDLAMLNRLQEGDPEALNALLDQHRDRLRRMVHLRMSPRLRTRIDGSDVIQDAMLEAHRRLPEYFAGSHLSFFSWLRFLTHQKLLELHRHHLDVEKRSAGRELAAGSLDRSEASSLSIAESLMAHNTSPSVAAQRIESRARLEAVLDGMEPNDREVLALRLIEQLTNDEAALELGLQPSATSKRFLRALQRLRDVLHDIPDNLAR